LSVGNFHFSQLTKGSVDHRYVFAACANSVLTLTALSLPSGYPSGLVIS